MIPDLKSRMLAGEPLIGAFLCLPSPETAEIFAESGFDWLILDTEHGPYDVLTAQRMLQAVGGRCPCVVRVPSFEEVWIKKALDIGASGVLVPLVRTAAEAERVARACRYAPEGTRGMGGARAHRYGLGFREYVDAANRRVAVILQAEHIEAVRAIGEIVRVPGLDAVFVGPYDLSASLGKPGRIDDPEVVQAVQAVREAVLAAGLALGIYCADPQAARRYIAQGFRLIGFGTDLGHLVRSLRESLSALRA
ncbi:MAG: aldolase/citrate lyase family protein [Desulfobacterales bacterium]